MALSDQLAKLRGGPSAERDHQAPKVPHERVTPWQYLKEVRQEMLKVTWPKREQVVQGTIRVIIVSLLFAVLLGVVDFGAQRGLDKILSRIPAAANAANNIAKPAAKPAATPTGLPAGIPPPPGFSTNATTNTTKK